MATEELEFNYAHPDEMSLNNDSGVVTTDSSQTSSPGKPLSRRQRKNRTRLQREQQQESCGLGIAARRRKLSKDESDKSSSESGIGSQESLKSDEVQQESSLSDNSDTKKSEAKPKNRADLELRRPSYRVFSHKLCKMSCLIQRYHLSKLDDAQILEKLNRHILTEEQLIRNGFPMIYESEKLVWDPLHKASVKQKDIFRNRHMEENNVYFKNWKPRCKIRNLCAQDQDNSSDDEDSFAPAVIKIQKKMNGTVDYFIVRANMSHDQLSVFCPKVCLRCSQLFNYINEEYGCYSMCAYHPETVVMRNQRVCLVCRKNSMTVGCQVNVNHVWSGSLPGLNGPCFGYVSTMPAKKAKAPVESVYALDCEMCYTQNGLELAQVTVVDLHGKIVYNKYVYPTQNIIDFNTRYSGITCRNYRPEKSVEDVQQDLCSMFDENTILIGHGLENDLRALKIVHNKIVDTSLLFGNGKNRMSLKNLAATRLDKHIQLNSHDAAEDARTTLELVLHFVYPKTPVSADKQGI